MHDTVIRLYLSGSLSASGLANAVLRGWITADEYAALTGEARSLEEEAYG